MKPTKAQIKESLLLQLEAKQANLPHFLDLIEEYMQFWEIERKLQADIKKRGVNYTETMSTGLKKTVNNPSIKDLAAVSKQKQAILEKLGITTEMPFDAEGDAL